MGSWNILVGIVILAVVAVSNANYGKPCTGYAHSEIYCYGDLLHTVQMAEYYEDQKTFVDKPLKRDPAEVITDFNNLGIIGDELNQTQRRTVLEFVDRNFDEDGTEFEDWNPTDWKENPAFLADIRNESLRQWADELHSFWKELGRKIKDDVRVNPQKYSMYYVTHPVIVPGGRFKEFYYWDSYWIQRGLLISEMQETVKGMIENFMEMVNLLGFIPNGGRIYYQRSQPPLLGPMVDSYYEATKDVDFLRANIETLIKEYDFFDVNRTVIFRVNGKDYKMAHYNVELTEPRPESFKEDYDLVEPLGLSDAEKEIMYANLKSGAESGWDFSSRWYVRQDGESLIDGNLTDTKTMDIIPVDLNSFMYWNAALLTKFCDLIKNETRCNTTHYHQEALAWKERIHEVLWDQEAGTWFDYDFVRGSKRKQFYPTNLSPLWVHAVNGDIRVFAKRSVDYLTKSGATNFPGGVPTSMLQTGLQWDFPNGWAPLNHLVVEALERSNEPSAQALAFELAQKWVRSNHLTYLLSKPNAMFEKYDVTTIGNAGGGGEYEVVIGFGWSNGVVLDFLKKYGDRLTPVDHLPEPEEVTSTPSSAPHFGRGAWVVISPLIAIVLKYLVL